MAGLANFDHVTGLVEKERNKKKKESVEKKPTVDQSQLGCSSRDITHSPPDYRGNLRRKS